MHPEGTRRVEIATTSETAALLAHLHQDDVCLGSTIFGRTVHALVRADATDAELVKRFEAKGFRHIEVREIEPSLEDVFVALTEERAKAKGAA